MCLPHRRGKLCSRDPPRRPQRVLCSGARWELRATPCVPGLNLDAAGEPDTRGGGGEGNIRPSQGAGRVRKPAWVVRRGEKKRVVSG